MKIANFLHDLTTAMKEFDLDHDAFSLGQLESKQWLIENIRMSLAHLGNVYILGGWYGILAAMMELERIGYNSIRSFDIDESCKEIADRINRTCLTDDWKFQAVTGDVNDLNYTNDKFNLYSYGKKEWVPTTSWADMIINTSCEHMTTDWYDNVPNNKTLALQSNDSVVEEGHINTVQSLEEFTNMYPMTQIYHASWKEFPKYTRFTAIGIK